MKTILTLSVALSVAAGAAHAGVVLSLIPANGVISGAPGQTIGWGFDLTSDPTDWTSITGTIDLSESNPLGVFTDFIGPQGGPSGGALDPGAPDWIQAFSGSLFTGLGSYAIDPFAPVGQTDNGMFLVQYESFSADPATCGSCLVSSGTLFENFTINTVAAPTPEPSSWLILLTGALALSRYRRKH